MGRRKSYDQRTGRSSRSAAVLAKAFLERPEMVLNAQGDLERVWQQHELQSYTHADIVQALRGRRAHERYELLEFIPPSAIKYACTKRWLVEQGGLFLVTDRAAVDLGLPRKGAMGALKFLKVAA